MKYLILDIETYSNTDQISYDDKIIAIAYKTENTSIQILEEWKFNEKIILTKFLSIYQNYKRPRLIGHNLLIFDLPIIINKAFLFGIDTLSNLMKLFLNSYPIDTIQVQLTKNSFNYKGLSLKNCMKNIGYKTSTYPGAMIKYLYDIHEYDAIREHVIEDVHLTEKLFKHLSKKIERK